jgi:hypothetical protein
MITDNLTLGLCIALTCTLLAALHWQPLGAGRMHQLKNYTLGVAAILAPYTLWLWAQGEAWLVPWLFAVAGGATVCVAYWIDERIAQHRIELRNAQAKADALEAHVAGVSDGN